jgi:outer membrane protein assembly factor BamB
MPEARRSKLVALAGRHLARRVAAGLLATMLGLGGVPALASGWAFPRGDATNSGFADVITRPAIRPLATVPGIGSYTAGSGPVIGPDGSVYLGSAEGVLRAFSPDGVLLWQRAIARGYAIGASPVIDADGSIYVVGTRTIRDHRGGERSTRSDSLLHRFNTTGALLWVAPFPGRHALLPAFASRGSGLAPATLWRENGQTVVMVPATYRAPGGYQVVLLAFSREGRLLHERQVSHVAHTVIGGSSLSDGEVVACVLTFGYGCLVLALAGFSIDPPAPPADAADRLPPGVAAAMPGAAVFRFAGGGTPFVVVSTGPAVVGYTYSLATGFTEIFRETDRRQHSTTAPLLLPDGHSVVGTGDLERSRNDFLSSGRIAFGGPNGSAIADLAMGEPIIAPLARTADSRLVVVRSFRTQILEGGQPVATIVYPGETIAPAAVSRSHIFLSTTGSMRSYDARSLALVGELPWFGGGQSSPAIAASGRVYALASNILFIWPGPDAGTQEPSREVAPRPREGLLDPRR